MSAVAANNAGELKFRLGAASDKITLGTGSVLALGATTADTTSLDWSDFSFATGQGFTTGTYPLIQDASLVTGGLSTVPADLTGVLAPGESGTLSIVGNNLDLIVSSAAAFSGSGTWVSNGASTWSSSGNWLDGAKSNGVPGLSGSTAHDTATFTNSGSVTSIDLTGVNPNLAALSFSYSNYTLTGGSLTLQGSTGTAATLNVSHGTESIGSALTLATATRMTVTGSADQLILGGQIGGTGGLTLAGSGSLILSGNENTFSGGTTVAGGDLYVAQTGSLRDGSALIVGAGGIFLFDPTASGSSIDPGIAADTGSLAQSAAPVPEPSTLASLAAAVICCLAARGWRRRHSIQQQ